MSEAAPLVWCDDRSVPADAAVVSARDSAFAEGCGCYTTMLCEAGRARWAERHARRLVADAATARVGELSLERARSAIRDSVQALWPEETGALRLQCTRSEDGSLRLIGIPRALGDDGPDWRTIAASEPHWGPMPWGGAKIVSHWPAALGRAEARARGVDEALLFDREDRLIEGSRSNIVIQRADGEVVTPNLERGGVSGMARDVLLEHWPRESGEPLHVTDIQREELSSARAIVAINSLRHARTIREFEGKPVGNLAAKALSAQLAKVIDEAPDIEIDD